MDRRRRGGSVLSVSGAKGDVTVIEPSAGERVVGRRAAESRATVPTLELSVEHAIEPQPSTGLVVSACGGALREHPRANSGYRDGQFELYSRINVGIVVTDADHYLIPTVFDADLKSARELEDEVERLTRDALAGGLPASAFSGATFTVWHAARHGLDAASIPVVPPQAGSLAAASKTLTLSCDHRILYGARAAAFLTAVRRRLEPAAERVWDLDAPA